MAGFNSLGLGAFGLLGKAVGMIPGVGGGRSNVPGPTSGITPYLQQIGGAVPGQGAAMLGMGMLQQFLAKKKKQQAGTMPTSGTTNAATTTPKSPADVGRGLAAKPSGGRAAYIGY